MNKWNSRVSLSLLAAICGIVITHALISINVIPVVEGHSTFSVIAVLVGTILIIYGWVRIFTRRPVRKAPDPLPKDE